MYTFYIYHLSIKDIWRGSHRVLKFSRFLARPTLFLETLEQHFVQIVVGDDSDVCFHTFWQEIHCTTTISTELQQLHPGVFQWGYLASVLQCLAQTSTFTLDIDANVKSLGAIGQALQKVMKDLRSETRQHPIQHRERFPSARWGIKKKQRPPPHPTNIYGGS